VLLLEPEACNTNNIKPELNIIAKLIHVVITCRLDLVTNLKLNTGT
jgi:hypothetical protein